MRFPRGSGNGVAMLSESRTRRGLVNPARSRCRRPCYSNAARRRPRATSHRAERTAPDRIELCSKFPQRPRSPAHRPAASFLAGFQVAQKIARTVHRDHLHRRLRPRRAGSSTEPSGALWGNGASPLEVGVPGCCLSSGQSLGGRLVKNGERPVAAHHRVRRRVFVTVRRSVPRANIPGVGGNFPCEDDRLSIRRKDRSSILTLLLARQLPQEFPWVRGKDKEMRVTRPLRLQIPDGHDEFACAFRSGAFLRVGARFGGGIFGSSRPCQGQSHKHAGQIAEGTFPSFCEPDLSAYFATSFFFNEVALASLFTSRKATLEASLANRLAPTFLIIASGTFFSGVYRGWCASL